MNHVEVYEKYKQMFPELVKHIDDWFPNGKNSVRVRFDGGSDFIFTYNNWTDWCYETVESHIRKMRGGANMKC